MNDHSFIDLVRGGTTVKVLVTGGLGLVGKSVVRDLLLEGHAVRLFDTPKAGRVQRLLHRLPGLRPRLRKLRRRLLSPLHRWWRRIRRRVSSASRGHRRRIHRRWRARHRTVTLWWGRCDRSHRVLSTHCLCRRWKQRDGHIPCFSGGRTYRPAWC